MTGQGGATPAPPTAAPPPSPADALSEGASRLARRLGHAFRDPSLLLQALCHRSWCSEQDGAPSNERLEFLGDAVLGLVVAEHCYCAYPDFAEGQLAKVRSAVVNSRVLAEVADELDVGSVLALGRGEESSGGRSKTSILADALEALIGAVYLDAGWGPARVLVLRLFGYRIGVVAHEPDVFDHKSRLQELTVRLGDGTPTYVVEGSGPDHDRHYVAEVFVSAVLRGRGEGSSKKDAEQHAAATAWRELAGA
ncbi:MAG TPA: ribonuclease III [Acidimicrobiales bacterium]|nr:ribonuclease III [Acidimicrobiales bacterium]